MSLLLLLGLELAEAQLVLGLSMSVATRPELSLRDYQISQLKCCYLIKNSLRVKFILLSGL